MPPMEIERKFTVKALPENLDSYPFHLIEQAYLNTDPVLRIRRQDDEYYLTYKGKGLMAKNIIFRSISPPMSICFRKPTASVFPKNDI